MGAFLDKPKTEKYNECGSGRGLRYALASMQGWRIEMEDAHSALIGLNSPTSNPPSGEEVSEGGLGQWSWFAVFDGHAGSRVSLHCARHLLDCVLADTDLREALSSAPSQDESQMQSAVAKGVREGFLQLDEKLRRIPEVANGEDKSGTTAVAALVSNDYIVFSNCGDSRAVVSGKGGVPVLITTDHKPSNPPERERIQNAGGSVMIQRVNGSLAVSRALGDFEYKNVDGKGPTEQLVSPEPELFWRKRATDDEFLILACDGVWDVMSNEEVCAFVNHRMSITDDLEAIANDVIDTCLNKGSRDNMSIIIIAFPGAPKVCEEAAKVDRELDEKLKSQLLEMAARNDGCESFSFYFQNLANENIENLPAGAGIFSKKTMLEEVFSARYPDKQESTREPMTNPLASLLFTNASSNKSALS